MTEPEPAGFDGDPAWSVTRTLRDGSTITIRPVREDDRDELRRGLEALSPESRYRRFLHHGTRPSEDVLTYLTRVDQKTHVAIGATIASPDLKTERGIGIARFVTLDEAPNTAEAAVTVIDDMHHKGVGSALLAELLHAARIRGIKTLRAEVLEENEPMRAILERSGAKKLTRSDGSIAYDLMIEEEPPAKTFFDILRAAAETMTMAFRFRW